MTELTFKRDKLRRDKTPTPGDLPCGIRPLIRLQEPDGREHLWLCPLDSCRRTVRMQYRADNPLPCCMGGPRPHAKQLLICEIFDIYQECFYRWMAKGENLGKPVIYPRNYMRFPVLARGDTMRDVAGVTERDL